MVNRTKYEIWIEILESCLWNNRSQTWLKRNLRMKTEDIRNHLDFLLDRGLIVKNSSYSKDYSFFSTTNLGKEAIIDFFNLITKYFKSSKKIKQ